VELLSWLENTSVVTWIRESPSLLGYTLYLSFHTVGLVLLVGPNVAIGMRVLGVVPRLPLAPMAAFVPWTTAGLWITVVTGSVLFATAPIGFVRNPVFWAKLAAIAAAVVSLRRLTRELFGEGRNPDAAPLPSGVRTYTIASLAFWSIAVVAGRLTAYSAQVVAQSVAAVLVLILLAAAAWALARLAGSGRREAFDARPSVARKGE
jgi:hypothetical protein